MKVFHETAATHEHFFARSTLAVFFHCPLMNNETALTHEQILLHTHEGWANAMPCSPKKFHLSRWLEHVLPRWTRYSRINHYPCIVHSWATHEPLMSHSWTVSTWPGPGVVLILAARCQLKPLLTSIHDLLMSHSLTTHDTSMDIGHVASTWQNIRIWFGLDWNSDTTRLRTIDW